MADYKSGKRSSAIMAALARKLSDRDISDLAAYYASLPKARTAPTTWQFQGSDDGENWTTLDEQTDVTSWTASELRDFTL